MPSNAVISALTSLLPSLPASNKPFPPSLVSQCESLLALSRQRATNLKPDEEIARAHACSEIACTRLRSQLRLPAIKNSAGIPCQPRVYAKLLKFLEGTLADAAGSLTPRGRKRDGDGNFKTTPMSGTGRKSLVATPNRTQPDIDGTPTKKSATDRKIGSGFLGKIKSIQKHANSDDSEKAPQFVMPSVRRLCNLFSTPTMIPHVYTGTCVILKLSGMWSSEIDMDASLQADIYALVIALYLMVLTRMQEGQMTTDIYTEVTTRSVEAFNLGETGVEKVEDSINRLNEEGWCSGEDWYESVPEDVFEFGSEAIAAAAGKAIADGEEANSGAQLESRDHRNRKSLLDEQDPEGVLLPGLGTMLHDGIDWTSADRCLDFKEWHASTLKSLNTPVKAGGRASRSIAVS